MNDVKSNPLGTNERDQLLKLQLRGYVVNRGTKADQELANRYFYFCSRQTFTWVEITPGRKTSDIRVEQLGRIVKLDELAKAEVEALLGRSLGPNLNFVPNIEGVPDHLAPQVAQELLRIADQFIPFALNPPRFVERPNHQSNSRKIDQLQ